MACFNAWDIGGCGCGSSACTAGQLTVIVHGTPNGCCICNDAGHLNVVATFNNGFGSTNAAWVSADNAWESGCNIDGHGGSYQVIYYPDSTGTTIYIYHWASSISCSGSPTTTSIINTGGVDLVSYYCSPLFSATYQITATNCAWLFALGVTRVTITGITGDPNCVTCSTCPSGMPTNLSITDALGTYTATWNPTLSLYVTPQLCSVSSTSPTADCTSGAGHCHAGTNVAGALYTYSIGCTSANHMTINRYWYELACASPSHQYSPCSCNPGGPQAYSSSGSVAVTCGSISWSGTLTKVSGNLSDPVGGSASFSQ